MFEHFKETPPYIDAPLPPPEEWPTVDSLPTSDTPPPPRDEDAPPEN